MKGLTYTQPKMTESVEGGFEHSGNFALNRQRRLYKVSIKDDFGNPLDLSIMD